MNFSQDIDSIHIRMHENDMTKEILNTSYTDAKKSNFNSLSKQILNLPVLPWQQSTCA